MTYKLQFKVSALKEWHKLDATVRQQFKSKLRERLETPRVPSAALHGLKDAYKIKLRQSGDRLVYQVEDHILVVTVIESLRAFDLVWIINKGRNGLELISTLVTANVVGEASRIGFGSALATIMLLISSVFIVIYLRIVMREDAR